MRRLDDVLPWATLAAMLVAQWLIFVVVPTEAEMGIVQRIFYFHVPAAFASYLCFAIVAASGAVYLWKGSPAADRLGMAAAEVGTLFCTLVLVTGPLWARPIWGVWWTWDPRLTMTLIMWAIYAGYVMLRAFGGDEDATSRYAAVLGIVGALAIPAVHYSALLLQGIHPAVLTRREGGSGLADPMMRMTLLVSTIAMLMLACWLIALRMRTARLETTVRGLRRQIESREGAGA